MLVSGDIATIQLEVNWGVGGSISSKKSARAATLASQVKFCKKIRLAYFLPKWGACYQFLSINLFCARHAIRPNFPALLVVFGEVDKSALRSHGPNFGIRP